MVGSDYRALLESSVQSQHPAQLDKTSPPSSEHLSATQRPQSHPSQLIKYRTAIMCFGKRSPTVSSSSSSSSEDLPPARLLDVPTVRRLNSPRCATAGAAYSHAAVGASDGAAEHAVNTENKNKTGDGALKIKPESKPKQGKLRSLRVCLAMLTQENSQEVVSLHPARRQSQLESSEDLLFWCVAARLYTVCIY